MESQNTINNDLSSAESPQNIFSPAFSLRGVRQFRGAQSILDDINLEIEKGKITALIGTPGAGKTSLLRLLNRLDDPSGGEIFYRSRPIIEYPVQNLRLRVGFVFQTPVMFPGTVGDNLRTALALGGKPVSDTENLIADTLKLAEIKSSLESRDGAQLSVGQKQRVSIARALMTSPEVLLMDEPTSALDPETADKLMETVRHLARKKNITVVMVTHRLSEAKKASDVTVVMEAGRIIATGATNHIFYVTQNSRIREFLGSGK